MPKFQGAAQRWRRGGSGGPLRAAGGAGLPTVRFEDLALTSTRSADNTDVRVQVLCRQPDGSWLRIMDRPEVPHP